MSRYADPGCSHPTEGFRSVDPVVDIESATIAGDLFHLTEKDSMDHAVFLMHSPPYGSLLDRAALDGQFVDHVPLDVHIGSIAIQRFIAERQPHVTLHGHVHESATLTGHWKQQFGRTWSFNAAHDGEALALIRFNLNDPARATRELV